MKIPKIILALLLMVCLYGNAWAQDANSGKINYSKHPQWVQMMDDPNVNYHEAVKAFNEFWKDRGEPEEEEAGEKKEDDRSLLKRMFKSEEKLKEENSQYVIQYKRFKQWKRDMEPYVQSDGSILSKEEQMRIWENSRK